MTSINERLKKIISSILVASILVPSLVFFPAPKKAEAFSHDIPLLTTIAINTGIIVVNTGVTVGLGTAEFGWRTMVKELLMIAARKIINGMTRNIINWINSGFHGNPLYVENPKSFFRDITKYEVRNLVNRVGYDSVRYPYGKDYARSIIDLYGQQAYENYQYSLSKVIYDPVLLEGYRNDFAVGGWNAFLINTQYPQNNYIGYQMLETEKLARELQGINQSAAQQVNTTLDRSLGFLAPQTCPSNEDYDIKWNQFNQPSFQSTTPYSPPSRTNFATDDEWGNEMLRYEAQYSEFVAAEKTVWDKKHTCPKGLVSTTPGSIIGNQVATALSSKIRQGELAAAMGNSIAAIFDALLNKLVDTGLNSLSKAFLSRPGPGGAGLADDDIPPPPDGGWDPNNPGGTHGIVSVDGGPTGGTCDYGGTYPNCALASENGTIFGAVYNDINKNGAPDSGESIPSGITISLVSADPASTFSLDFTQRNGSGYNFVGLKGFQYIVSYTPPAGYVGTTCTSVLVTASPNPGTNVNFGMAPDDGTVAPPDCSGNTIPPPNTNGGIQGIIWNDINKDGVPNGVESLLTTSVDLLDASGNTVLNSMQTLGSGSASQQTVSFYSYLFYTLSAGTQYQVRVNVPPGYLPVTCTTIKVTAGAYPQYTARNFTFVNSGDPNPPPAPTGCAGPTGGGGGGGGGASTCSQQSSPLAIVQCNRNPYPASYLSLTPDIVPFLKQVAVDLNAASISGGPFGVLVKTSGNNCSGYSCDIICSGQGGAQQQWDVLADSGSKENAAWNSVGNITVRQCEIQGGGSGGSGGGGGGTDDINLSQVIFLHNNVSSWPITSTVTGTSVTTSDVCVNHTKAGKWPISLLGNPPIQIEGNPWIFAKFGGQWYGATYDWLRPGQTCKAETAVSLGRDQIRIAPMDASWIPRMGDQIGLMMSTRARDSVQAGQERSNVVLITWPY